MRLSNLDRTENHYIIDLKNNDWLDKQREAGRIVAQTHLLLKNIVEDDYSKYTLLELNKIAEDFIYKNKGDPTFKNYKGFPAGVCISVNENVVHGIPTDTYLQNGDVVSFDLGTTIDGAIADSAITVIVGEPKEESHIELVKANKEALDNAIKAVVAGSRLGVIGESITNVARKYKFANIKDYGGHSLTWSNPHSNPFVPNYGRSDEGIRMQPGLTIAIEPMFVDSNSNKTKILEDNWTVMAKGISSHWEHTIFIHEDSVEIITDREKYII